MCERQRACVWTCCCTCAGNVAMHAPRGISAARARAPPSPPKTLCRGPPFARAEGGWGARSR
eukprot:130992-Chlamydomonas_euryale.AAC.3